MYLSTSIRDFKVTDKGIHKMVHGGKLTYLLYFLFPFELYINKLNFVYIDRSELTWYVQWYQLFVK